MEPIDLSGVSPGALLLVDSAPIIFQLEGHPDLAPRFLPVFQAQADGRVRLAVTTVTIAEVLTGPLRHGAEALARRYRTTLESWRVVPLDADIAETAARLRAAYRLKLPDAVQAASALAIGAEALVTFDRDFSGLPALRVIA